MAPRLTKFQHELICSKISQGFNDDEIANDVLCTTRAVRRARSTSLRFGTTTKPANRTGPDPKVTPVIWEAIRSRLAKEPDLVQREMLSFLYDKFGVDISITTMNRALHARNMTWKKLRRVALQQRAELRHFYQYRLKVQGVRSYHMVFIDESGVNNPDVYRGKGWAKKGTTPVQKDKFQREDRVQILAAYTQRGILLSRVFVGSTDKATFEDFIEQLLRHCGKWPEPESVLLMDNATFHYSDRITEMCKEAGVKNDFTPPYTPVVSPIEECFGEIKTTAKSRRKEQAGLVRRDFEAYVRQCVAAVGSRRGSAEGHFRKAGYYVEEPPKNA